jgi:hypothetical protein
MGSLARNWTFGFGLAMAALGGSSAWSQDGFGPMSLEAGATARPTYTSDELDGLIRRLGHDEFSIRQQAEAELFALVERTGDRERLAADLQQFWLDPALPFEIRDRLEAIVTALPTIAPRDTEVAVTDRVELWRRQLGSSQPEARAAVEAEIAVMLESGVEMGPLLVALQQVLASEELSAQDRKSLEPIYDSAFGAWLVSDAGEGTLDPVTTERIAELVDQLVEAAPRNNETMRSEFASAERQLKFLLARQDTWTETRDAIQEALDRESLRGEAFSKLNQLSDWCRPALVAEIWTRLDGRDGEVFRRQNVAQYLYIGVPWRSPGQPDEGRASHFDYCDDTRCRCVNGYTLAPGHYPVGVAFPHPDVTQRTIFHIRNLSTPRRRMAFDHQLANGYTMPDDQARRLKDITRRTCEQFLSGKRLLTPDLVRMMPALDPKEVSLFASEWFSREVPQEMASFIGLIDRDLLQTLSEDGTPEALPGLMKGLAEDRLSGLADESPFDFGWLAALRIAQRHPTREVDEWLAQQIGQEESLSSSGGEIGATAAAILLNRHGREPDQFGLKTSAIDPLLMQRVLPLTPAEFSDEDNRQTVLHWWQAQSGRLAEHPTREEYQSR